MRTIVVASGIVVGLTFLAYIVHRSHANRAARGSRPLNLEQYVTVIFTTSAVRSNPDTEMVEANSQSFCFAQQLVSCPKIFVCDGYKLKSAQTAAHKSYRAGVIPLNHEGKYKEFKKRLRRLIADAKHPNDPFQNSTVIELAEHHGFSFAVKAALSHVKTPYVVVIQHDRTFMRPVDMGALVSVLEDTQCHDINMISLLTRTTLNHSERVRSRCMATVVNGGTCAMTEADWELAQQPRHVHGVRLVPMLQWLDSTHIARTHYYQKFVFARGRVKRGAFIEDKLGNSMLADLRSIGRDVIKKYGCWLFDDGSKSPMVAHMNGRGYLTESLRSAQVAQNHAHGGRKHDASAHADDDLETAQEG